MGWERRKREHECRLPTVLETHRKRSEVGDVWKCRKCKTRWELTYKGVYSETSAGPMHENAWLKLGSPEDVWPATGKGRPPRPGVPLPDPPRQTGPDWLYTEREDGKDARGLDWIKTMPTKGPR